MSDTAAIAQSVQAKVFRELTRVVDQLHPGKMVLAYSGGLDSTVLLHIVADWMRDVVAGGIHDSESVSILAVYVNHRTPKADEWEQHCRLHSERLAVPFAASHIVAEPVAGRSPEEDLRLKRYAALRGYTRPGDFLLTAHHRDDQAETVFLQLLRGAGPESLAAMLPFRESDGVCIARPMLGLTRDEIKVYARTRKLHWIDDPSNASLRYDRNYLRHRVVPLLAERWPEWTAAVARAAGHQAEATELLDGIADTLLQNCTLSDGTLNLTVAAALDDVSKKLLLRRWIRRHNLPLPSHRQFQKLLDMYLSADSQVRSGMVCWKGAQIRCYRRRLYAMPPLTEINISGPKTWQPGTELELPEINRKLSWEALRAQMPALADTSALTVKFRQGGEKYYHAEKNYHQSLKKVFQQLGVPPWERNRIPLVYRDDELRLIWGYDAELKSVWASSG